ncbi:unnamed protein product [Caenorhabditis nigoni]
MSAKAIQLKSPKLGRIPIRPFLMFCSFLELLWTLSVFISEPQTTFNVIITALGASFNFGLIYGALKYNEKALVYNQILAFFTMRLSVAMLCFLPVFYTSVISSDYQKYLKAELLGNPLKIGAEVDESINNRFSKLARKNPEQKIEQAAAVKFLTGFIVGEMVVFEFVFYFLYSLVVYVMIKRLRKFIAARKETYGKEFMA